MRLTSIIIIATIMQVSANVSAQKINFIGKNVPMEKIMSIIKDQTGYDFVLSTENVEKNRRTSVNFKNTPLEDALAWTLKGTDLTYLIEQNTIVIIPVSKSIFTKIADYLAFIDVKGKVLDDNGRPLAGAVIRVKGSNTNTTTNEDGEFSIRDLNENSILQINYVGYIMKEISISALKQSNIVKMEIANHNLEEVNIVNTGFQKLPKERATGSFELVDKELLNRSPGTDVITRLKGVTTSTIFGNPNNSPITPNPQANSIPGARKLTAQQQLTIRGISSIEIAGENMSPLVILDNFPYDGDINNINPNDVESITLLKDAASASMWGIRASNGVIVITTKSAKYNQPVNISFNSNITMGEKPNLFYNDNRINSSDYIDIEKMLFKEGIYDDELSYPFLYSSSPVVNLLDKQRALSIEDVQGRQAIDKKIDSYRKYDIRNDLEKYIYKTSVNQQYAMTISGGGNDMSYFVSGGYDNNKDSEIGIGYKRINLRNRLTYNPIKSLQVATDVFFTNNNYFAPASTNPANGRILLHLPSTTYTRLADDNGVPLELVNPTNFSLPVKSSYRATAGNGRLLDWSYKPLEDIGTNSGNSKNQNLLMNIGLNYKFSDEFSVDVNYQYGKNIEESESIYDLNSFAMRDFINTYTQYSSTDLSSAPIYNIPLGGSYFRRDYFSINNNLRGKLNFSKKWNDVHEITALVGAEILGVKGYSTPVIQLYGYNPDPLTGQALNYNTPLALLNDPDNIGTEIFRPNVDALSKTINRNTSIFSNVVYNYASKYTVSGSLRKDASNLFGVKTNRRGQPSWSVGLSWNIEKEPFFKIDILEYLKLRATYGYLGNINNTVSAYPTIAYALFPDPSTLFNYATVLNPPNQGLGPERSGIANLGIDFALKGNRVSGSIEYYDKRSKNLIAPTPIDLTTGFTSLSVNSANLKTTGLDITLKSTNIQNGHFQWNSVLLFSFTHNVVTKYLLPRSDFSSAFIPTTTGQLQNRSYIEGQDPFSLYTYDFAGLDPNTGDPMGYIEGKPSKDYDKLLNIKQKDLVSHGSVIPLYYGSFRNDFNWNNLTFSANILYKFDYKLSVPGINYSALLSTNTSSVVDYDKRWQKPGDEIKTNVPSMIFPADFRRDVFYNASSARVISGDHIRLQDIRLSYTFSKSNRYFKRLSIYSNINNLGILWRANKMGIDPDVLTNTYPAPKTYTLGVIIGF